MTEKCCACNEEAVDRIFTSTFGDFPVCQKHLERTMDYLIKLKQIKEAIANLEKGEGNILNILGGKR